MKKISVTTFVILALMAKVFSQQTESKDLELNDSFRTNSNLYLGVLGDGSLVSLNFEKFYKKTSRGFFSSRLGVGYNEEFQLCLTNNCPSPRRFINIPHSISYNFGSNRHYFETGVGGVLLLNSTPDYKIFPTLGYRYLPTKSKKISFKLNLSLPVPLRGNTIEDEIYRTAVYSPVGIGIGISLNSEEMKN